MVNEVNDSQSGLHKSLKVWAILAPEEKLSVERARQIAPKSVNGDADIVTSSGSLFFIRDWGDPFGMLLISKGCHGRGYVTASGSTSLHTGIGLV